MPVIVRNNVSDTLADAVSSTNTAIVVDNGSKFPAPTGDEYFYATIESPNGVIEVVKVTSRLNDILSIERGQDGTFAADFDAGAVVEMRITAASVRDIFENPQPAIPDANAVTYLNTLNSVLEALRNYGIIER